MMLLKAYQYFFYRLYRFYESSPYNKWWSEWKAYVSILTLCIWLYCGIGTFYHYFFNSPIKSSNLSIDLSTIIFGLIIGIANWFLFEHQDKWKEIVKEFDKLPKQKNKIGSVIVWLIILSIILFYWFYSIPLLSKIKYE